jgi:hypothetical protein
MAGHASRRLARSLFRPLMTAAAGPATGGRGSAGACGALFAAGFPAATGGRVAGGLATTVTPRFAVAAAPLAAAARSSANARGFAANPALEEESGDDASKV